MQNRNKKHNQKKLPAFSFVELLLAIGIATITIASVGFFAIDAYRYSQVNEERLQASNYLQEQIKAINLVKNDSWSSLAALQGLGTYHLVYENEKYHPEAGPLVVDSFEIGFTVDSVNRNASGNIVEAGGTADWQSRKVTINVAWTDVIGVEQQVVADSYLNNWATPRWQQSLPSDFAGGTFSDTIVTGTGDGAIELDLSPTLEGDWCNPALTVTSFDIPGQGVPQAISAIYGNAFLGTGINSSGISFENILIDHSVSPPQIAVENTYSGYKTNDIFGETNYGYLATDNNAEEIAILDLNTNPYVRIGYFNASGSTDANSVYVVGNVGYMTQGNQLRTFDLSSKTGSRPQLDSLTLYATGTEMYVRNGYAFISIAGHARELQIVNVSNPSNISTVGYADVNGEAAVDLFVNEAGTKAYLATNVSSSKPELFVIDTTSKNGNRPTLSTYESNGMDPKGISTTDDLKIIIVGTGGSQQYQVIDASSGQLVKCGGLAVANGVYGVSTVIDSVGNVWSYIITGETNAEFKILKGGLGGGGGNGQGDQYLNSGEYVSTVYDTSSTTTTYTGFYCTAEILPNTNVQIHMRTGTTSNLDSVPWTGVDGTTNSSYACGNLQIPHVSLNNKRYIQYRITFTSDRINTPIFESFEIYYEP